jgi:hypothetical protein
MPKSSQTKRRFTRKNSAKMSRKYRRKAAMWGGAEQTTTKKEEKQKMTDILNASKDEIFKSERISTQPCNDPEYKEIGIVHSSESIAVNILRDIGTDFFNAFGATGFDNSIYDQLRNTCFQKLHDKISDNQKICNIRLDIERDKSSIYMHVYGTLMENKNMAVPLEKSVAEEKVDTAVVEPEVKEEEKGPEKEGVETEEPEKEEEEKSSEKETTKPV